MTRCLPSEIEDPSEAAMLLVSEAVVGLPPILRGMCVSASTKITGEMLSKVVDGGERSPSLREAHQTVQTLKTRCFRFCMDDDSETQERVSIISSSTCALNHGSRQAIAFFHLLELVDKDLTSSFSLISNRPEEMSAMTDVPSSLLLIRPLMSTYDLNAVAVEAQLKVAIPDGLDLTTPIVPVLVGHLPRSDVKSRKIQRKKKPLSSVCD
jgi:AP-3 complex subunit delta-1